MCVCVCVCVLEGGGAGTIKTHNTIDFKNICFFVRTRRNKTVLRRVSTCLRSYFRPRVKFAPIVSCFCFAGKLVCVLNLCALSLAKSFSAENLPLVMSCVNRRRAFLAQGARVGVGVGGLWPDWQTDSVMPLTVWLFMPHTGWLIV